MPTRQEATMGHLYLSLIVLLQLAKKDNLGHATPPVREFTFTQEPTSILTNISYRLSDTTRWSGISSAVECAQRVTHSCQGTRGFLHQSGPGLCVPLLWLHSGQGQASSGVPSGELHLTTDNLCPDLFQTVEYGAERHVACVLKITPSTTYQDATSQCVSLGGFLASVKTSEKLALVAGQAQGINLWVGMDDLDSKGSYVWQEDNTGLTTEVQDAVFVPGEPNNGWNVEDCVHYRGTHGKLNDQHCWDKMQALCEIRQPDAQC